METIDIQKLCDSIKRVAPKAPITFVDEKTMYFRGERLEIEGNKALTRRYEFQFNNPESFIEGLRTFGLMLNYREIPIVLKIYLNGKKQKNETGR